MDTNKQETKKYTQHTQKASLCSILCKEVFYCPGAFTAPVIQWAPALSASPTQRPLSIPVASPLTQKTLEAVTEKVKHMSDRYVLVLNSYLSS